MHSTAHSNQRRFQIRYRTKAMVSRLSGKDVQSNGSVVFSRDYELLFLRLSIAASGWNYALKRGVITAEGWLDPQESMGVQPECIAKALHSWCKRLLSGTYKRKAAVWSVIHFATIVDEGASPSDRASGQRGSDAEPFRRARCASLGCTRVRRRNRAHDAVLSFSKLV